MVTYRLRDRPAVEWALARGATLIHNLLQEIEQLSPVIREKVRFEGADRTLAELDSFRFKLMDDRLTDGERPPDERS